MQTCIKDGKVTIVMSYEEWQELSDIVNYTLNHPTPLNRGVQRDKICAQILEDAVKLDVVFHDMVQKEMDKVPDYLKKAIRETPEEIKIPILKEAITV